METVASMMGQDSSWLIFFIRVVLITDNVFDDTVAWVRIFKRSSYFSK
jgi:hypothetical protein